MVAIAWLLPSAQTVQFNSPHNTNGYTHMNIEQLFLVLVTLAPIFGIFALLAAIAEFWEWLEDRAERKLPRARVTRL